MPTAASATDPRVAAEIASAESGISGFAGPHGALISFDTRRPEARAAILASLDRLAAGAHLGGRPIPVTEETRAAVRAKHPSASKALIDIEAQIAATFFGGRA